MPNLCPARRRKPLAALILVSALALAGCGQSKEAIELDAKLARAEAAVVKAEVAQHAAEAAATRARSDKLAAASHEEIEPAPQDGNGIADIGNPAPEPAPAPAPEPANQTAMAALN